MSKAETNANDQVSAVSLKLPTFWSNNPKLWFCSVEAQFSVRNIVADDTKYNYVVAALSDDMANSVADVLLEPPATGKYEAIKNALTRFYRTPPVKQVLSFIRTGTMSDRRPREVAREIKSLDASLEQYRMALFASAMPPQIQTHLLARDYENLGEMAETAEGLSTQSVPWINAMPRPKSTGPNQSTGSLCYFHKKFGNKARRCREPCTWPSRQVNTSQCLPENDNASR